MNSDKQNQIVETLKDRFEKYPHRHPHVDWKVVQARLEASPDKLRSLAEMERTGGEPDVIDFDEKSGEIIFVDCAPESPSGRRSLCYDQVALEARKKHKPQGSAVGMAEAMGIEIVTEEEYRRLQQLGEFDKKTSSWVLTPPDVRELGGAMFCDRRFGRVWVYHNGAESYYASRGFRGMLRV